MKRILIAGLTIFSLAHAILIAEKVIKVKHSFEDLNKNQRDYEPNDDPLYDEIMKELKLEEGKKGSEGNSVELRLAESMRDESRVMKMKQKRDQIID